MMEWKGLYGDLRMINWVVLLVLSIASYLFMGEERTAGVILGGIIITVNFGVLQHTISRAFSAENTMTRGKASIIAKYYLRFLGLGVVLYLLITRGLVDPVGLAVGLSSMTISITVLGVIRAIKEARGEAV